MASTKYDETGQPVTVVYSDIYEARKLLVPNRFGVALLVRDKKIVNAWYGIKQTLGWLGPDDSESPAECLIAVFNRSDKPIKVTLREAQLNNRDILRSPERWNLSGMETMRLLLRDLKIPSYGTEIACQLHLKIEEIDAVHTVTLRRFTEDEADEYFKKWEHRDTNSDEFFAEVAEATDSERAESSH